MQTRPSCRENAPNARQIDSPSARLLAPPIRTPCYCGEYWSVGGRYEAHHPATLRSFSRLASVCPQNVFFGFLASEQSHEEMAPPAFLLRFTTGQQRLRARALLIPSCLRAVILYLFYLCASASPEMPLLGLVRRVFAQAQNKRLLKRMGDKYVDIRLSGATQRASQCSSNASPVARSASRTTQTTASQISSPPTSSHNASTTVDSTGRAGNYSSSSSQRDSQSRLSVSVCVVVPVQSAEALWIDKLRAQEESYRRSVCRSSLSSVSNADNGTRRRCESEDEAFELWDYVCPQFVRPKLANEWV